MALAAALALLIGGWILWRELSAPRGLMAPRPAPEAELPDPPPLPPSVLSVPVRIPLGPLVDALEGAVPRRMGDLADKRPVEGNDRAHVAYELERGPFRASLEGRTARVGTVVRYRGRGWYDAPVLPEVSASCGTDDDEEPPRLDVVLEAPIGVTPDWKLATRSRVARVEPVSESDRDRCRITAIKIDVTDRVVRAARAALEERTPEVDAAAAAVDLRSKFEAWWGLLQEPVELTEGVWLVMDPVAVKQGEIRGEGDRVDVMVGLTARPKVVLGDRPLLPEVPLPPLDTGAVEPGLRILAEGEADYRAAGRLLTRELGGTELTAGDRRVRIRRVEVFGIGGGRLALAVELRGDVAARLWLVGTPQYDAASGQVSVPDLAWDVATNDLIVEGASWLARLGIADLLRERARWPAGPAVAWVAERLHEGLNRRLSDDVALEGTVDSVQVLGVRATTETLWVRAAATASARLVVLDER